jgi:hypothetical protein
MERMTDLDTLATLDPARNRAVSDTEMIRAEADLERIIATPPAAESKQRRRRRAGAGAGALGGSIAAVAVLAISVVTGGSAAYADWTATPSPATTEQSVAFASECAESWAAPTTLGSDDVVLGELRGKAQIALVRNGQDVLLCSGVDPDVPVGWERLYDPAVSTEAAPDADGLRIYGIETSGEGAEGYSYDVGRVGSDVTGVDVRTSKGVVQATVEDGWFVAWWPGTNQADAKVLDVHLRDGQTVRAPWTKWGE